MPPDSKTCAACKYENPPDATFCGECGAPLRAEVRCPGCGRANPVGTKFCHGCGQRGAMLAFQSAHRALQCAVAIQRAFAARNRRQGDEPLHVRIGLHAGEVIREADDFFGRNVILAARIAGQAQGGGILVSLPLKKLTHSAGDIAFGTVREVTLKGITDPQRVCDVFWT